MSAYFYANCIATVLYICFIPESPSWLFMNDSKSEEGIKILNYIAWFNGSNLRVPDDVIVENDKPVEESQSMFETHKSRLNYSMNATIQEDEQKSAVSNKRRFILKDVFEQLRQLFRDKKHSPTNYRMLCFFLVVFNMYFLGLYNATQLKGDRIKIHMMFGLA
jgi:hypothetical protein